MNAPISKSLSQATKYIQSGRVVAFPTGTSYGLAVDALQGNALQRLYNLKNRPHKKTFTVFIHPEHIDEYFEITAREKQALKEYDNQPLTILLQSKPALSHLAQDGYVGLRVIDNPIMQDLALRLNVPLTATSANKSGDTPCYTPTCVQDNFSWDKGNGVYDMSLALILDNPPLPKSPPSTIIKINNGQLEIIRPGAYKL